MAHLHTLPKTIVLARHAVNSIAQRLGCGISESGATSLLVAAGADAAADLARDAYQSDCETMARKLAHSQWIALGHPRAASQ